MDEQQLVGEGLGVKREGEVFVIDPHSWRVAYRGPVDDRFASGNPNGAAPAHAYTADAIDAVIARKAPAVASVEMHAGKAVPFRRRPARRPSPRSPTPRPWRPSSSRSAPPAT